MLGVIIAEISKKCGQTLSILIVKIKATQGLLCHSLRCPHLEVERLLLQNWAFQHHPNYKMS